MLDLVFEGATVFDGSGAPPRSVDVGVQDGYIAEVGRISTRASRRLDARGAWLTPGFVDLHTHYDGQASWDPHFGPSLQNGVTTVVFGNCGVGFAPLAPGERSRAIDDLISLMEGVEDIPGAALMEGVRFDWQSFPQYLDALERLPHSLDFLVQVPHDPLRMAVMGERALERAQATDEDLTAMQTLLREALDAGAAGFSTARTDNHRTSRGVPTPASEADARELGALARVFRDRRRGVLQMVSDFDVLHGPERFNGEFDLVELIARESERPLSISWMQRDPGGEQWQGIRARTEAAAAAGLPISLQASARGIGVILGLDTTFHPFMGFPGFVEIAALPLAERAAAMREPTRKARILSERPGRLSGDGTSVPPIVDLMLARIDLISARMFPLQISTRPGPDYEPAAAESFRAQAQRHGLPVLEVLYDYLAAGEGRQLIHFPIFNYNAGSLDVVREMLTHPLALFGLSDAGAHVGTLCDASTTTFLLTHWARDRRTGTLPPERLIEMLTSRNARHMGLIDRGRIAVGLRADLNLIDPARLAIGETTVARDLPAGGKRLHQDIQGYLGTWVAGVSVAENGEPTAARPGRLVRMR